MELREKYPSILNLWSEPPPAFRPKKEDRISQLIGRHIRADLHGRGIVVNREVKIQSALGGQPGELVDLKIDAVTHEPERSTADTISIILEVKGCWNPELRAAMKTFQLADRYLAMNKCSTGVYVVGWFLCDAWGGKDARKRQCCFKTMDGARRTFTRQAAKLSNDTRTIKAFLIDATLPNKRPARKRKKR